MGFFFVVLFWNTVDLIVGVVVVEAVVGVVAIVVGLVVILGAGAEVGEDPSSA